MNKKVIRANKITDSAIDIFSKAIDEIEKAQSLLIAANEENLKESEDKKDAIEKLRSEITQLKISTEYNLIAYDRNKVTIKNINDIFNQRD